MMQKELYANKIYRFGWDEFEEFLSKEVFKRPIELHQEDFYYWFVKDDLRIDEDYTQEDYEETLKLLGDVMGLKIETVIVDEEHVYVIGN